MPALRTRDTSRSLEVTTDAPAPPALQIASPTPKSFAFPAQHNLSGSPYSSPSHSPFEPDLHPFATYTQPVAIPTLLPDGPSTIAFEPSQRSFTPDSLRSASPNPSLHKRRKSSCSSDSDARPKKGEDGYIKRPENAFILFRRKYCDDKKEKEEAEKAHQAGGPQKKQRQADLSKEISMKWKQLGAEDKLYWENLAKEKKKEHEQMYPNYVYRPQRGKDKDGRAKKKSTSRRRSEDESNGVKFYVAQQPSANRYQEISLPRVHHVYPASADSDEPSLLGPLLAKMPGDSLSNGFDWVPSASYVPPSVATGQFNPNFVSMEFTQGLFTQPQIRRPSAMSIASPTESKNGPLPSPLSRISPPSSSGNSSGSSSPSSPSTGPFTPSSAAIPFSFMPPMPPQDFEHLGPLDPIDPSLLQQSQHHPGEMDAMQADLQSSAHQDFSQFTWSWPESSTPAMLDNNWDINSIPSALLGEQPGMGKMDETGLEFGQDFSQALEGSLYGADPTLIGGYDEYLAGTAFA